MSYADSVSSLQSIGASLGVNPSIISQGAWLFSCFYGVYPTAISFDAVCCLQIAELDCGASFQKVLTPQAIVQQASSLGLTTSDGNPVDEDSLNQSVSSIRNFIESSFSYPDLSTFDCTLKLIEQMFGGTYWSKSVFCQRIFGVAAGVINDMYRYPNCVQYHPRHWSIAAIHYALCDVLSSNEGKDQETDIEKTWRDWVANGTRWWINFEVKSISKFDSFPILSDLLDKVYTHVETDTKLYQYLFHPSLKRVNSSNSFPNNSDISEETMNCSSFDFSDGNTSESFSITYSKKTGSPLHVAINSKLSISQIRYLIEEKNVDLLDIRYDGASSLFIASEQGNTDAVKLILEKAKNLDILEQLIDKHKLSGATPLHVASYLGYRDIVEILLQNKANPNTSLFTNNNTPLYDSINEGKLDVSELLLEYNADSSTYCINAGQCMHAAAHKDAVSIINILHDRIPQQIHSRKAPNGETPLHLAIQAGNYAAAEKLLKLGAPASIADFRIGAFNHEGFNGLTPWHCALFKKQRELLQLLLSYGAVPDLPILHIGDLNRVYHSLIPPSTNDSPTSSYDQSYTNGTEDEPLPKRPRVS